MELNNLLDDPAPFLSAPDPATRRLAISAMSRRMNPQWAAALVDLLRTDAEPRVRAEAAEVLAETGKSALPALQAASTDHSGLVREAIATAFGEIRVPTTTTWLRSAAESDPDKLVREAAVAALGALADTEAVPLLIQLLANGPPQVRRRSVAALSVFDGAHVEAAIRSAREDRNPMVREAAEMVVGR